MHLPQNREIMMVSSGDGTLHLYKYHYPDQRRIKVRAALCASVPVVGGRRRDLHARVPLHAGVQDPKGQELGVAGSVELLASRNLSTQPVSSLDWSPDKEGLFCCAAFDQTLR